MVTLVKGQIATSVASSKLVFLLKTKIGSSESLTNSMILKRHSPTQNQLLSCPRTINVRYVHSIKCITLSESQTTKIPNKKIRIAVSLIFSSYTGKMKSFVRYHYRFRTSVVSRKKRRCLRVYLNKSILKQERFCVSISKSAKVS